MQNKLFIYKALTAIATAFILLDAAFQPVSIAARIEICTFGLAFGLFAHFIGGILRRNETARSAAA
jgi:hypothetical protein